jgi:hypothetical protein
VVNGFGVDDLGHAWRHRPRLNPIGTAEAILPTLKLTGREAILFEYLA